MTDNENILTDAFLAIRGRLHRAAMAILRDRMDADDAVQETFVKMSKARSSTPARTPPRSSTSSAASKPQASR